MIKKTLQEAARMQLYPYAWPRVGLQSEAAKRLLIW